MNTDKGKAMIAFAQKYKSLDERDMQTFRRNKTYELEAMSAKYTSTKPDKEGKYPPVGLGIYATEIYRFYDIPCKPKPTDDDEELVKAFRRRAQTNFESDVKWALDADSPELPLQNLIENKLLEIIERLKEEIIKKYTDSLTEKVKEVTADQIREKLLHQYQNNPRRENYSLFEVVEEITKEFKIEVEWNPDELLQKVEDTLERYVTDRKGDIYSETIEFQSLPKPEEELKPFYDVVEEALGARPEDCLEVREAVEWRLSQ